jgi:LAO/AO transport system kinase
VSGAAAGAADVARAALGRRRADVARLLNLVEDLRPTAAERRDDATAELLAAGRRPAPVVGITGTPGSGKSSLLSRVTEVMLAERPELTIAVVAVDPSSPTSGGALLGDRTRMRFAPDDDRLFFRSQASANHLGGLGPATFDACLVLSMLYDVVLVETVGVGQNEADVRHLADHVYLVIAPLGGDEVQYLKAGIIEIPDGFVVNKCDEAGADKAYHQLTASLWLARPFDPELPILRTSARTGEGVDALAELLLRAVDEPPAEPLTTRAPYFFGRWVATEWGRAGSRHLDAELGGAEAFLASNDGRLGHAQVAFATSFAPDR